MHLRRVVSPSPSAETRALSAKRPYGDAGHNTLGEVWHTRRPRSLPRMNRNSTRRRSVRRQRNTKALGKKLISAKLTAPWHLTIGPTSAVPELLFAEMPSRQRGGQRGGASLRRAPLSAKNAREKKLCLPPFPPPLCRVCRWETFGKECVGNYFGLARKLGALCRVCRWKALGEV